MKGFNVSRFSLVTTVIGNWYSLTHTRGVSRKNLYRASTITEVEFVGGFELKAHQNAKRRVCVSILIFDFKEAADVVKDIERQAYFRTGRRCPQGPDLALSKPTRDTF